jgi:hypothetical protein
MATREGEGKHMTTDRSTARPPRWAEGLLRLLLKPDDRESVSGDLLEQYRDTIVPSLGSRADRWYVRQVGWFLLRACWLPGVLIGSALVARYLFDTLLPTRDLAQRSRIMSWAIIAVCLLGALRTSLRTRSLRAGLLTSILSGALGGVISIFGGVLMIAFQPGILDEWRQTGGVDEVFLVVPLIMVWVGIVMGTVGGLVSKTLAALYSASAKTNNA